MGPRRDGKRLLVARRRHLPVMSWSLRLHGFAAAFFSCGQQIRSKGPAALAAMAARGFPLLHTAAVQGYFVRDPGRARQAAVDLLGLCDVSSEGLSAADKPQLEAAVAAASFDARLEAIMDWSTGTTARRNALSSWVAARVEVREARS